MGKKFSQASVKISKINGTTTDKKTLNNLIKVLRRKVYITDSSTFKNLVQELTGNGSIRKSPGECTMFQQIAESGEINQMYPTPIVSSLPSSFVSKPIEEIPIMENIIEDYGFQESSPELSFDSTTFTTLESSQELNYVPAVGFSTHEEFQSNCSFGSHDMKSFDPQYGEMESWLLEMDPFVYTYDTFAVVVMPPEVCVYDYDLSEIM